MRRIPFLLSNLFILAFVFCLIQFGCGGGGGDGESTPSPPANITGDAILDLQVVDGGSWQSGGTPPAPPTGYTLLNIDLNEGTGGNYIWLYYKVGKADGSEGEPVSKIYTVDEYDGETPQGGTKLPVNLNENAHGGSVHEPLWLYYLKSSWPVARCVVVDNRTKGKKAYGPPEAEGKYQIVWVEELLPDEWKTPSEYPQPPDAQDLNEGESFAPLVLSDWIFIGYCKD